MKSTLHSMLFCLLLLCSHYSSAQENYFEVNADILPSNCIDADMTEDAIVQLIGSPLQNAAVILQNGMRTKAEIVQVNTGGKEDVNLACIVQVGAENNASIRQCGEGNLNAIYQDGQNNCGIQKTDGNANHSLLLQRGDDNKSSQILIGDDLHSTVVQIGNCNQVYRVETGTGGLDYRITQIGDGMRMSIVNGK